MNFDPGVLEIKNVVAIIAPQELVRGSGQLDVERVALGALTVKELVHRFVNGSTLQIDAHDDKQCFAEICSNMTCEGMPCENTSANYL